MPISFNEIPTALRVPGQYVEIDNSNAVRGLPGMPHTILAIGQRLAAGGVVAGVPTPITDPTQAIDGFGRGSMLAAMCASLLTATQGWVKLVAIALDDAGAGVAATGTITMGGAPTRAGTLSAWIGGRRVRAAVASGDTPATVATNLVAAITADLDMAVTAVVNGVTPEQVDLTARHKGEAGNGIDVRINFYADEVLPAGLTAAVVAMAGGTGNPDIAPVLTAMADSWYTEIAFPYTDAANLVALEAELAARFGATVMQDAVAFAFHSGTYAALSTFGSGRNSPHLVVMGAMAMPTTTWEAAAALTGVVAYHAAIDPARPFQTLNLPGVMAPAEADRFTATERNLLLFDGISTFNVDPSGGVAIERTITTYQLNAFGIEDPSYLDLNTMFTLAFLRYSLRQRIAQKFPRHKLAADGTRVASGQAIVTPNIIKTEIIALARLWEEAGLVEGVEQFKTDLVAEIDIADPNRINVLALPNLINQLRIFAANLQFIR